MSIVVDLSVYFEVHDNVATTIFTQTIPLNSAGLVNITMQAGRLSTGDFRTWIKAVPFTRGAGSVTVGTISDLVTAVGSAGSSTWSFTVVASGGNLLLQVTGQSLGDTSWFAKIAGIVIN